jgi:hypothetical protein
MVRLQRSMTWRPSAVRPYNSQAGPELLPDEFERPDQGFLVFNGIQIGNMNEL